MKVKGRWIVQLVIAILVVIIGIFILARQDLFKQILVITLGVLALVTGIISLATMPKYSFGQFNHGITLGKGVSGIVVGTLAIIMPLATGGAVWTTIIYILGAQLVLSAVVVFIDSIAVKSAGFPAAPLVTEGIVSLLFAVVLFLFPRDVANLLVTILGITVLIVGLTLALLAIIFRNRGGATVEAVDVEVEDDR